SRASIAFFAHSTVFGGSFGEPFGASFGGSFGDSFGGGSFGGSIGGGSAPAPRTVTAIAAATRTPAMPTRRSRMPPPGMEESNRSGGERPAGAHPRRVVLRPRPRRPRRPRNPRTHPRGRGRRARNGPRRGPRRRRGPRGAPAS